ARVAVALAGVRTVPAGTRVGGGDEHEPAGERDRAAGPGDIHLGLLQRDPKGLERVPAELAELVEEEDAPVSPSHPARSRRGPAAGGEAPPRGCGGGRRDGAAGGGPAVLAADAGDAGDLDHLARAERRKQ